MHTTDPHSSSTHNSSRVLDRPKMPLFWEVKDIGKISLMFLQAISHWLSSFIIRGNFRKLWWTVFEALLAKLKQVPQKWQFMRTYSYANFNFLQKNVRENFIRNGLFWFNHFCANVGHFKPRQFFGARLSVNFEIDCQ